MLDVPVSSVALAANGVVREKNKVMITSGAATSDLTGAQCSPNTIQWTFDGYMLAKSVAVAVGGEGGGDDAFGTGSIRADGPTITPAYRFRVKASAESKAPWDYYNLVKTLSPDEVWRPLSAGDCVLVRT